MHVCVYIHNYIIYVSNACFVCVYNYVIYVVYVCEKKWLVMTLVNEGFY